MFVSHKFPMAYGRALVSEPIPLHIPSDPADALAFAIRTDRQADALLAEGRFEAAERLSHAALEARARATGVQGMSLHPNALPEEMEAEARRLEAMSAEPLATEQQVRDLQQGAANLRRLAWRTRLALRQRASLRVLQ